MKTNQMIYLPVDFMLNLIPEISAPFMLILCQNTQDEETTRPLTFTHGLLQASELI